MGMSDVTCAISYLPIQCGDACRFLFLRQRMAWDDEAIAGSWEHVWARWVPLLFPIKGIYDGYGRLDKKTLENPALIKFQTEALARVAQRLPQSVLQELEKFPNSIQSLMSACERGWLKLRLPRDRFREEEKQTFQTLRVSPCYVSERAYQAMIASPEDRGIGAWRSNLLRQGSERGMTYGLKMTVEYHRDLPDRQAKLAKALKGTEMEEEAGEYLDQTMPMMFQELLPNHEDAPDSLVVGGDWNPDVTVYKTLFKFTDEDWNQLEIAFFDFKVFFMTLRNELRREIHPELHRDQFYFPHQGLGAHRMLARYLEKWCRDLEERSREEDGCDD